MISNRKSILTDLAKTIEKRRRQKERIMARIQRDRGKRELDNDMDRVDNCLCATLYRFVLDLTITARYNVLQNMI